jgi:sarcosine oxidase
MSDSTFDVIVLGCGGFGSASTCHLARRGLRVLAIDRFSPPHDQGSSHGETRIIRKAYFEHPDYVPLLKRAYQLWDELSHQTQESRRLEEQKLFVRCGLLLAGPSTGEVIAGARQSAQQHQLTLESMTAAEAVRRFPMLRISDELETVFEPDAGFLWAERCVAAHLHDATSHGAQFAFNEAIIDVQFGSSSVTVKTSGGTYSAACAVVTAGAWTGQLSPEYKEWIQVKRKILYWHSVSNSVWADLTRAPAHLFEFPGSGRQFYGFPSVDGQTVKLAEHTGGDFIADPSAVDRIVRAEEGVGVSNYATRCLSGVSGTATRSAVCMYSMSPDSHFLLDRLTHVPVVVAAGFSGHGFKFTSVLGEAVADLVTNGQTSLPIDFLSSRRLLSRQM